MRFQNYAIRRNCGHEFRPAQVPSWPGVQVSASCGEAVTSRQVRIQPLSSLSMFLFQLIAVENKETKQNQQSKNMQEPIAFNAQQRGHGSCKGRKNTFPSTWPEQQEYTNQYKSHQFNHSRGACNSYKTIRITTENLSIRTTRTKLFLNIWQHGSLFLNMQICCSYSICIQSCGGTYCSGACPSRETSQND